jgi:copper transport protein
MFAIKHVKKGTVTALFLLLGLIGFLFSASPALAHSKLEKTVPQKGAVVQTPPAQIEMIYKKPVDVLPDAVSVTAPSGQNVQKKVASDPENKNRIIISLQPNLKPGLYKVKAKVLSQDGHLLSETFSFTITQPKPSPKPDPSPAPTPVPQPVKKEAPAPRNDTMVPATPSATSSDTGSGEQLSLETLPNWLIFVGLALSFGGTFFTFYIAKTKEAYTRWKRWQIPLYVLVAIATLALFFIRKVNLPELSMGELASLSIGWVPLAQLGIAILCFAIISTRYTLPFLGISLALNALVGHSYSSEYGGLLSIVMDMLHLLALSVWFGGLFALLVLLPREKKWQWIKEKGRAFSPWALSSILLVILTGFVMALDYAPSWNDFIGSAWGLSVMVKAGLTLVILLLGYWQFRTVRQDDETETVRFIRRTKWEVVLGFLALLVAAALINFAPLASETENVPAKEPSINISIKCKDTTKHA